MSADFGLRGNELNGEEYKALYDAAKDGLQNQGANVSGKRLRVTTQDGRQILKYENTSGVIGFFKLLFFRNEYRLGTISNYLKGKTIVPDESRSSSISWLNTKLEKHNQSNKNDIIPVIAVAAKTLSQPAAEKTGSVAPAPTPAALQQEREPIVAQEEVAPPAASAPVAQLFVSDAEAVTEPEPTAMPAPVVQQAPVRQPAEPKELVEIAQSAFISEEEREPRKPVAVPESGTDVKPREAEPAVMPAPSARAFVNEIESKKFQPQEFPESGNKSVSEQAPKPRESIAVPHEGSEMEPKELELAPLIERLRAEDAPLSKLALEVDELSENDAVDLFKNFPLDKESLKKVIELSLYLKKNDKVFEKYLIETYQHVSRTLKYSPLPEERRQASFAQSYIKLTPIQVAGKFTSPGAGDVHNKLFEKARNLGKLIADTALPLAENVNPIIKRMEARDVSLAGLALEVDKLSDNDAEALFKEIPVEIRSFEKAIELSLYLKKNDKIFERFLIEISKNNVRAKLYIQTAFLKVVSKFIPKYGDNSPNELHEKAEKLKMAVEASVKGSKR